ncbi:hypothetical protein P609_18805 [Comamonas thiooxydans]|nr:hypothetical protein P609_18805 [Comamonas thiooxydans]
MGMIVAPAALQDKELLTHAIKAFQYEIHLNTFVAMR